MKQIASDDVGDLWTPARAEAIALDHGIERLLETHWKVIALCREWHARHGKPPTLSEIARAAHLSVADVEHLFRADPVLMIFRIAGLPDPDLRCGPGQTGGGV